MKTIKKILLPTDFSDYSAAATEYACTLTDKFASELHLIHVLDVHLSATPMFGMGLTLPQFIEESSKAAKEKLGGVLDSGWSQGKKIVYHLAQGSPFLEIIRYTKANDIELVVMSTHGYTGLAHVLMGSVAEKVVRKASCPVLTVRPEGHQFVAP